MWPLASSTYPNRDLSLSAADLGHRSVSDEVIWLLCYFFSWHDWIEIQRRHKKGEVFSVCTGRQSWTPPSWWSLSWLNAGHIWSEIRTAALSKRSLWHCKEWTLENLYCAVHLYCNCAFVRATHQQQLIQSVNFSYPCYIGNISAPLHLLLRSWLLKVDSKHQLCWLSGRLYIRTQIVGRLTACCCQSNKSCPLWPHWLVNGAELWTVMSFIWAVCHRHFLVQVPPLFTLPLSLHLTRFLSLSKGNPILKPLVSLHNLLCHCFC